MSVAGARCSRIQDYSLTFDGQKTTDKSNKTCGGERLHKQVRLQC